MLSGDLAALSSPSRRDLSFALQSHLRRWINCRITADDDGGGDDDGDDGDDDGADRHTVMDSVLLTAILDHPAECECNYLARKHATCPRDANTDQYFALSACQCNQQVDVADNRHANESVAYYDCLA